MSMKVKFFKVLQGKKKKERNKRRLQVIQFVFKSFSHSVHLVNNSSKNCNRRIRYSHCNVFLVCYF